MRPPGRLKCASFLLFFLLLAALKPGSAQADMILNSVGTVEWDPSLQPGGPGAIAISVSSNGNAPNANVMNAFSVGIRLIPEAGSIGQLRVSGAGQPSQDRVFTNYAAPLVVALQDSVTTISGDNAEFANVPIPASGRRLFDLFLAPQSANISGAFLIVADGPKSNYFTTTEFDGLKFGNVGENVFVLGRVVVNVTSVPEPSSTLLLTLTCGWLIRRRKRLL